MHLHIHLHQKRSSAPLDTVSGSPDSLDNGLYLYNNEDYDYSMARGSRMSHKLLCFVVGFLFLLLTTSVSPTIEAKSDTYTLDVLSRQTAAFNTGAKKENDPIIDIIQEITEPLYMSYLEEIVAFGTRYTGTTSCYNTGTYLSNELENMGLSVRYQEWTNGGYQDRNIEATLPGTNQSSDELYIIFGHYDTVSNCPGADDDASGVATVLVAASLLSQYTFEHTIRFVAFSGEEQWMLGSHEYVEEAIQNGDNIVAVLNVDMIGFALTPDDASKIKIYDNGAPGWVTYFTMDIGEVYYDYIHLTAIPSGYADSDQTYFWENGFDGIFYHEYNFNDYYHTSQDTIAHLNIDYALNCSRLSIATLAGLAEISGGSNTPPDTPQQPTGPTDGETNIDYTFTTQTVDHDSSIIYYQWSWGDEISDWLGPYESGVDVQMTNAWSINGTYVVKVQAKDDLDAISNWSEPLNITIVAKPGLEIGEVTGGFGLHVVIRNTGAMDATQIQWNISFQGFVFIGKEKTGSIETIAPDSFLTVKTGLIVGFGQVEVTITAAAEGLAPLEQHVSAFVVGPFVLRVTSL
jgi:aminopeptidase YwaD